MPTAFRTRLVPGHAAGDLWASWTPVWFYEGTPAGQAALTGRDGTRRPFVTFNPASADTPTWYALGYQCPEDAPPGVYKSDFGGVPGPDFEIVTPTQVPRRKRDYYVIDAPSTADDLIELFDHFTARNGKSKLAPGPVWLSAGRHTWEKDIDFPPGVWVDGVGARVEALPDGRYGSRMVHGGQDCTFRGVEFEPWHLVQHSDPPVTGTRYLECGFRGNGVQSLGWGMAGVHVEGCEFTGVSVNDSGLVFRNRFRGPEGGLNVGGPSDGGLALIDNDFDGTARGPVVNTGNGPVLNALFADNRVHGQKADANGGEAFLCEGPNPFDRFLIVHHRVWDNDSYGLSTWSCPIPTGGKVIDFRQEGGLGIWLAGAGEITQTGVLVDVWELVDSMGVLIGWVDGTGKSWGHGVRGNTLTRGSVIGFRRSGMMNQGNYDQNRLARTRVFDQAPGIPGWAANSCDLTVRCVDLPPDVIGTTDVEMN